MSFADELKKGKYNNEESNTYNYVQERELESVKSEIKSICISASREGKNSISGYICINYDEYQSSFYLSEKLPTIDDYTKEVNDINKAHYNNNGGLYSVSPGKTEHPIYGNYLRFDNKEKADAYKDKLLNKINEFGFKKVSLKVEKFDNIVVVINTKASFWMGNITASMSTRKDPGNIYMIHIEISW